MSKYVLHDHVSGQEYSTHPNLEGATISALFHVNNGDKITWKYKNKIHLGYVNDDAVARFGIECDE